MSILGTRVVRKEDPKFLTVGGTYVDDVVDERLAGAARVTFVRSTMASARILSIDVSEAVAAPGVVAVLTAADLDLAPIPPSVPLLNQEMARPVLADGTGYHRTDAAVNEPGPTSRVAPRAAMRRSDVAPGATDRRQDRPGAGRRTRPAAVFHGHRYCDPTVGPPLGDG